MDLMGLFPTFSCHARNRVAAFKSATETKTQFKIMYVVFVSFLASSCYILLSKLVMTFDAKIGNFVVSTTKTEML